ncbi:GNAT family N-acetyltransferase [Inhella gelatinilytica]|uniref:GNAT family N-acetyltransferase n=1 Tax=Inhella gelatinilytica TaxID=2795030 RepID=A0A931IWB9_9BURK|nr:GNAT family N-acetyltransferase [Inhella gelatinilytica]MBH9551818.1 GNAT family N-acetyltransferase [Inhella gelatinilytica]
MKLTTERLALLPPAAVSAAAVADFTRRNAVHFAPWDPPRPAAVETEAYWAEKLPAQQAVQDRGEGWRWFLVRPEAPDRVIGKAELSSIVRGPHHSANLGYALDAQAQGQGLMTEALTTIVAAAFGPGIALHRLQAGYRPENQRSGRVLDRLGFREIGLARDYLFIDGAWRDHRLVELINPQWTAPVGWGA